MVSFVCTNMGAQLSTNSVGKCEGDAPRLFEEADLASGCCVVVKMDLSIASLVRSCESTQSMSAVSLFVGGSP